MPKPEFDAAIVGFGPVGAFCALELAHAGLRVAILERTHAIVDLPRAVGLDGESVRACQRLGFGDEVAAILQPPRERDEVCFTDSKRRVLFGIDVAEFGRNGWRDIAFFDQPELEALLREQISRSDRIETFLGHEVTEITQDANTVTLRSVDDRSELQHELNAAFAIGCDGASSFVRSATGIGWTSLGYDQDWLVIDVLQGPDARLPESTMQVCDPARLTTYVCVKDPNRRWEFQLNEGETREEMLRPEKIEELLASWLPREQYEIRRAAVYQFHAATADRWRDGRIFLAGDSAHQTPPFLGQGLNAGFRDAVNLGWKIPLVLSGTCDAALLDSYATERDAHALDLVEGAVSIGRLMETLAAREAGRPDPYPPADQPPGFGQGRTSPALRHGVLIEEQVGGLHGTGNLLAQPWVRDATGRECMLDELLGPGFALVGREAKSLELSASGRALASQLAAPGVALDSLELVRGEFDQSFEQHEAVIIRPDRHVFGMVDASWSLEGLLEALADKLALARAD